MFLIGYWPICLLAQQQNWQGQVNQIFGFFVRELALYINSYSNKMFQEY